MTHAIGRRVAAVIAAALLGLGIASTSAIAAPAQPQGVWVPYDSYNYTSGGCQDMRYFLRDSGQYSLSRSRCDLVYISPARYRLKVLI